MGERRARLDPPWSRRELVLLLVLLAVAAAVRLPGLISRAIWYDEAISLLTAAGNADAPWSEDPVSAGEARRLFAGEMGWREAVEDVRQYDVHPPGYYWVLGKWRSLFGPSLEAARAFSLVCSVAAVGVLYLWLRSAVPRGSWVMALVFALSTGAAHGGHEARAYALASVLILTAAWLGYRGGPESGLRTRAVTGLAAAFLAGLALHVNYLALFPAAAIAAWIAVDRWRGSRWLAAAVPVLALVVAAAALPVLSDQLGRRPDQLSGYAGWLAELRVLLVINTQMAGIPVPRISAPQGEAGPRALLGVGLCVALLAVTLYHLVRGHGGLNRRFWSLAALLVVAPSAGIWVLDLAFDKRLHVSRYVSFAGPALAIFLSYGLVRLAASNRRVVGGLSLVSLLAIQASNLNWGLELCPNSEFGSDARSVAELIRTTSSPRSVVALGEGYNHAGNPGPLIYELHPEVQVLSFGVDTDLDRLVRELARFDDLWLIFSVDEGTRAVEEELLRRLRDSGRYRGILRRGLAHHLARIGGAVPADSARDQA